MRSPTASGWYWSGMRLGTAGALILVTASAGGYVLWNRSRQAARTAAVRADLDAGRYGSARKRLDAWLSARPDAAEAYYLKARLGVLTEQPDLAAGSWERARDLRYDQESLAVLRAVLQAWGGHHDAAEPVLRRAFREARRPAPEVDLGLARVALAKRELDLADDAVARWMHEAPFDPRPFLWKNDVDRQRGGDDVARLCNYRAAVQRDPSLARARLGLANQLQQMGRLDEAAIEYDTLLTRDPKNVQGRVGAGLTAILRGQLDAAARHLEAALAVKPAEPAALRELAHIDLRRGAIGRARARIQALLAVDPFDPDAHSALALALHASGDETKARVEDARARELREEHQRISGLRDALARTPGDLAVRFEVARWMLDHGREAEGLEATRVLLRARPSHVETLRLLTDYHERKGSPGLANYYRALAAQASSAP